MFDQALIESSTRMGRNAMSLCFPLSLALHVLAIAALLGASLCFVGEAPEPPVPVILDFPTPPPPLGDPDARPQRRQLSRPVAFKAPEMPAPRRIQENVSEVPATTEPEPLANNGSRETGDVEGGPPGDRNGVDGSVLPLTNREQAFPIPGDVQAPELIYRVEPDYPEAARKTGIQGVVILQAIITATGSVEEIQVLKPVHPLLDAAAERAVRQWRYKPATLYRRAVRVFLSVSVAFTLHE